MKRNTSIPTDGSADPIPSGIQAWDDRIEEGRVRERRAFIFGCCGGVMGLAGAGSLIHSLVRGSPPPLLAELCRGEVLAVRTVDLPGTRPRLEDVAEDLKAWVRGAREVLIDLHALGRQARRTYALTLKGSAAEAKLQAYHQGNKLDEAARTKTVYLEGQTAFPQSGVPDSNSWLCEWTERTTGRDGSSKSETAWRMTVSFVLRPPTTADELKRNPHGIYVDSFNWEAVTPRRGQVAERAR